MSPEHTLSVKKALSRMEVSESPKNVGRRAVEQKLIDEKFSLQKNKKGMLHQGLPLT